VEKEKPDEACYMASLYFLAGNASYLGLHLVYLIHAFYPGNYVTGTIRDYSRTREIGILQSRCGYRFRWDRTSTLGTENAVPEVHS
jgi:hypothetical protein